MKFSTTTKTALKIIRTMILLELKEPDSDFSIDPTPFLLKDIASEMGVSMRSLEVIARELVKNDILDSKKGRLGGFSLPIGYPRTTVFDVVKAIDGFPEKSPNQKDLISFMSENVKEFFQVISIEVLKEYEV